MVIKTIFIANATSHQQQYHTHLITIVVIIIIFIFHGFCRRPPSLNPFPKWWPGGMGKKRESSRQDYAKYARKWMGRYVIKVNRKYSEPYPFARTNKRRMWTEQVPQQLMVDRVMCTYIVRWSADLDELCVAPIYTTDPLPKFYPTAWHVSSSPCMCPGAIFSPVYMSYEHRTWHITDKVGRKRRGRERAHQW